jgi:hypothetical protein
MDAVPRTAAAQASFDFSSWSSVIIFDDSTQLRQRR